MMFGYFYSYCYFMCCYSQLFLCCVIQDIDDDDIDHDDLISIIQKMKVAKSDEK